MSAAPLSLKELAQRALPMPWDKSPTEVPFASRHAFRDAITPQVFLETVEALERLSAQAERLRPPGSQPTDAEKSAAGVLAKLGGNVAPKAADPAPVYREACSECGSRSCEGDCEDDFDDEFQMFEDRDMGASS